LKVERQLQFNTADGSEFQVSDIVRWYYKVQFSKRCEIIDIVYNEGKTTPKNR